MQYIPFPTCLETSGPLSLHYGISESINCTIASVPDDLYHLLEYYVHADVPMTCRMPTGPLVRIPKEHEHDEKRKDEEETGIAALKGPSYTPITFALQGTLQTSHLHLWTDMNVLAHRVGGSNGKRRAQKGYVVAGTAYSVPEFDASVLKKTAGKSKEEKDRAVVDAAREPWTAGHGTKVVRGQPLMFSFNVRWVDGGKAIGWPGSGGFGSEEEEGSPVAGFFSKMLFFVAAAGLGGMAALYWERKRRASWRGDGILGVPPRGKGSVGITYGNGGRMNGYGGYSASSGTGKRD